MVRIGGDTQAVLNFEYRIPIAGPVTLAPFVDIGNSWVLDSKALRRRVADSAGRLQLQDVQFLSSTNSGIRMSTGLELQITLPVVHLPFRLIYGFNPARIDRNYVGPTAGTPLSIHDPRGGFKFSIGKTF
jgi:outer membrane protein insertion porin family